VLQFGIPKCSDNCANTNQCDKVSGSCNNGCKTGWYGTKCLDSCTTNCIQGECDDSGICTQGCNGKRYGQKCDSLCSNCLTTCNRNSGVCDSTCVNRNAFHYSLEYIFHYHHTHLVCSLWYNYLSI
jgi:hypothetical protein